MQRFVLVAFLIQEDLFGISKAYWMKANPWYHQPSTVLHHQNFYLPLVPSSTKQMAPYFGSGNYENSISNEDSLRSHQWWKQKKKRRRNKKQEIPLIIEEDIAIDPEENSFRLGLRWDRFPEKRWNNTIHYEISNEYRPRERTIIESALKTFDFLSCLEFVPWDGKAADYLYIEHSKERKGTFMTCVNEPQGGEMARMEKVKEGLDCWKE